MASRTDARLLKTTKFPPEFSKKVDMQKVNLGVMKKWIASRISEILGNEDDVVIEMCFNLVDGPRYPDIKALQIQLTGFLDKDTATFCRELWKLFLSAQDSPQGVPKELLEAKKLELMQEKLEQGKAGDDARKRREEPNRRDHHETELIIAKGAGMTVDLTTAAAPERRRGHDLLIRDTVDLGARIMAIATYHADEMGLSMDEDVTADPRDPPLLHRLDLALLRVVVRALLRVDEETHHDGMSNNGSDRGPILAHPGETRIDLGDGETEMNPRPPKGLADKTREVDLVVEVDLHPHQLRLAVPEVIQHQEAGAGAGAAHAAMDGGAEARQRNHQTDEEAIGDHLPVGATARRHRRAVVEDLSITLHDMLLLANKFKQKPWDKNTKTGNGQAWNRNPSLTRILSAVSVQHEEL
ncbi:PWI domain mRNA processing protein [Cordyceps javanica]|uniref:PWI domain mRNA processing protein n=1 Tax=Cordyceps javanica TaxID=43265 RepID=A0A545W3L9_9HYPO|nr:PWI domain mRNA processing protein [Cordyceps javanica]TQW08495.1 PWI domain mRNA processing protein [Cordyceps javanica]